MLKELSQCFQCPSFDDTMHAQASRMPGLLASQLTRYRTSRWPKRQGLSPRASCVDQHFAVATMYAGFHEADPMDSLFPKHDCQVVVPYLHPEEGSPESFCHICRTRRGSCRCSSSICIGGIATSTFCAGSCCLFLV